MYVTVISNVWLRVFEVDIGMTDENEESYTAVPDNNEL
jgi:hypothetical protein